ncbi:MAG TPA: DUF3606 domain-containing protein [Flavobacterium sp.]|jgi:hypothetical protein
MDNKQKTDYRDRTRVNMSEAYEVQYWKEKWNISSQQLSGAIRAAGSANVKKIEAYLREKGKLQ